ncbi:sulfatase [Chroococcus sp. FPU101]|uniref:sulfatase family protein n=1 Tax=Chroococcus sp. FPU101 TaxID=1974212 RepID=UPI001A8D185C|nr:sulfatase [Chroococcus sp. FPU101]GFE68569.1 acetylglucosamine-6-sulfatase [Chroococcus sp. FPU101]
MKIARRKFVQGTIFGATLGIAGSLTNKYFSAATENNKRPNFVILVTDDMRWDCLGVAGNRVIQTPNLDALAYDGTLFLNHFVTTSICPSSRASIFTGDYARRHKIWDFDTALTPEQFRLSYPYLLRSAGYETAFIGKWGLGGELAVTEFDYWKGFEGQGYYFEPGQKIHSTQLLTNQALDYFNQYSGTKPFCLSLSYKAPHAQDNSPEPFQIDPKFANLYQDVTIAEISTNTAANFKNLPLFLQESEGRIRWQGRFNQPEFEESIKQYYRLITGVDDSVRQIVEKLKQLNVYDQTYIIFTSDNGFFLGERGLSDKWFGYEESIRTPLIIRSPGNPYKQLIPAMTLNIDIAPTILNLAGIDLSESMQGKSLVPLIQEKTESLRDIWFYEHLLNIPKIPKTEGIRTADYKYLSYLIPNQNYEMLFNLKQDPLEENNLAHLPQYQDKLQEFRQAVNQFSKSLV